jgi:hypothetical protein
MTSAIEDALESPVASLSLRGEPSATTATQTPMLCDEPDCLYCNGPETD